MQKSLKSGLFAHADDCLPRALLLVYASQVLEPSNKISKIVGKRPKHCKAEAEDPQPAALRVYLQQRCAQLQEQVPEDTVLRAILTSLSQDDHGDNEFMDEAALGVLALKLHVDVGVLIAGARMDHILVSLYPGEAAFQRG